MDCLFNRKVPKSSKTRLIFRPRAKTFITGLSSEYECSYDSEVLSQYISESQFNFLFQSLNDELFSYWPCYTCFFCGYFCCPCTLGLSLLCPNLCITQAKSKLLQKIQSMNALHLSPKGLRLVYRQGCSTSWLELEIVQRSSSMEQTVVTTSSELNLRGEEAK